MAPPKRSIIPMIDINYKNFSPAEKKVADFFINNDTDDIDLSAKAMTKMLYVSEATLSRFAKKSGFHGYRELAFAYKNQEKKKHASMTNITKGVLSIYEDLLDKEYDLIDEAQLDRIVGYINNYHRIFVGGKGSSGIAAEEMELRFMRIGININAISYVDRMRMQTVFMNADCLVIGFSISGSTEDVLYMLKAAHKNGAKTILVTAYNQEEFKDFCDEIILVPSYQHMDYGNSISPQFPLLVLQDIIYSKYMQKNHLLKESLHDNTLKALRKELS